MWQINDNWEFKGLLGNNKIHKTKERDAYREVDKNKVHSVTIWSFPTVMSEKDKYEYYDNDDGVFKLWHEKYLELYVIQCNNELTRVCSSSCWRVWVEDLSAAGFPEKNLSATSSANTDTDRNGPKKDVLASSLPTAWVTTSGWKFDCNKTSDFSLLTAYKMQLDESLLHTELHKTAEQ